ncbi:MAG: hypothetical protein K8S24_10180 [Candidatus Aegiribacteria sp.]|nr:hypothetical protein [Candidatus Aegiribacteria sp.]
MLKSGTHSLSAILEDKYKSGHEIDIRRLAANAVPFLNKELTIEDQIKFIRERDRKLWLEMESSHLLSHSLSILINEFPKSKFILTIRDCYSWMNSFMNHHLSHDSADFWWKLRRDYFRADHFQHTAEEQVLLDRGLYTVNGYFSYWTDYNRSILDTVPEERLLVIRTDRIGDNLQNIADFLGICASTLNYSKSHAFKARKRYDPIWEIDREFLESKVDEYCSDLMQRYFPEVKSLEDAVVKHRVEPVN